MIISIKGYIGSGKTTISKKIENMFNYKIINADKIISEIYETNKDLQETICNSFKMEVFNKKELASIVFSDKEKLNELEKIVHPILEKSIMDKLDGGNFLIDCQVIDKLNIKVDGEIITTAKKDTLVKRVIKRDGRSKEEILDILKIQEKFQIVDKKTFVIDTEKNEEEILNDLRKIFKIFEDYKNKRYEE